VFDKHNATNKFGETRKLLVDCRSDEGLEKTLTVARELAEKLQILAFFDQKKEEAVPI
jgi:hypothetical protein